MLLQIPIWLNGLFIFTTLLTLYLFCRDVNTSRRLSALPGGKSAADARNPRRRIALLFSAWLIVQGVVTYSGFYTDTSTRPPRVLLLAGPPLIGILWVVLSKRGRRWMDSLNLHQLTMVHFVRIAVEICLLYLSTYRVVPALMTFEGHNWDIFSGFTAPIMWWISFGKSRYVRGILLAWNIVCLGLLANIVITAVLSIPGPLQRLSFDQPNIAVQYFPFSWLPAFIVPIVLLSHIVSIRKLVLMDSTEK